MGEEIFRVGGLIFCAVVLSYFIIDIIAEKMAEKKPKPIINKDDDLEEFSHLIYQAEVIKRKNS